jgi:hypothetical protein
LYAKDSFLRYFLKNYFQHAGAAEVDDDDFGDFEEAGDNDGFGQFETSTVEVQEPVKDVEDSFSELFNDSEKVNNLNHKFSQVKTSRF